MVLEGRSVREVAEDHGVSKSWLYELAARYRERGEQGLDELSPTSSLELEGSAKAAWADLLKARRP